MNINDQTRIYAYTGVMQPKKKVLFSFFAPFLSFLGAGGEYKSSMDLET